MPSQPTRSAVASETGKKSVDVVTLSVSPMAVLASVSRAGCSVWMPSRAVTRLALATVCFAPLAVKAPVPSGSRRTPAVLSSALVIKYDSALNSYKLPVVVIH